MKPYLHCLFLLGAGVASAHNMPIQVTTTPNGTGLDILGIPPTGALIDDGFDIFTDSPGFGTTLASLGPPAGTELQLETLSGLLFWNRNEVVETLATLSIESPNEDSLGVPINSAVSYYDIAADTQPQSGLTWAVVPGANAWDAHGEYILSPGDAGSPAQGVYAVQVRLASPTLAPTEPFLLSFGFGLDPDFDSLEIQTGLAAITDSLAALPGDYDGSGTIDGGDFVYWATEFGSTTSTADGNHDQFVDAADYTVLRDLSPATTTSTVAAALPVNAAAVPEPAGALSAALAMLGFGLIHHRHRLRGARFS